MLIRFKNKAFNLMTFAMLGGNGCAVLALTVPFEFPSGDCVSDGAVRGHAHRA